MKRKFFIGLIAFTIVTGGIGLIAATPYPLLMSLAGAMYSAYFYYAEYVREDREDW